MSIFFISRLTKILVYFLLVFEAFFLTAVFTTAFFATGFFAFAGALFIIFFGFAADFAVDFLTAFFIAGFFTVFVFTAAFFSTAFLPAAGFLLVTTFTDFSFSSPRTLPNISSHFS